jgi:hypothetical protein
VSLAVGDQMVLPVSSTLLSTSVLTFKKRIIQAKHENAVKLIIKCIRMEFSIIG